MLFGAAVHQIASLFAQVLHGKGRASAVAQQALQCCAVIRCNAHASVHRKPTVLVAEHLFGITTLQQPPAHDGAQNAAAQGGLHLGYGIRINPADRLEKHTSDKRWDRPELARKDLLTLPVPVFAVWSKP